MLHGGGVVGFICVIRFYHALDTLVLKSWSGKSSREVGWSMKTSGGEEDVRGWLELDGSIGARCRVLLRLSTSPPKLRPVHIIVKVDWTGSLLREIHQSWNFGSLSLVRLPVSVCFLK